MAIRHFPYSSHPYCFRRICIPLWNGIQILSGSIGQPILTRQCSLSLSFQTDLLCNYTFKLVGLVKTHCFTFFLRWCSKWGTYYRGVLMTLFMAYNYQTPSFGNFMGQHVISSFSYICQEKAERQFAKLEKGSWPGHELDHKIYI